MKKNVFYVLTLIAVLFVLFGCKSGKYEDKGCLEIYVIKDKFISYGDKDVIDLNSIQIPDKPLVSCDDIRSFKLDFADKSTELYLKKGAEEKVNSAIMGLKLSSVHRGPMIVLTINRKPKYYGCLWKSISSVTPPDVPIMMDWPVGFLEPGNRDYGKIFIK